MYAACQSLGLCLYVVYMYTQYYRCIIVVTLKDSYQA